eukprot:Clim_evm47s55 gene=Clim_evmTU47s55
MRPTQILRIQDLKVMPGILPIKKLRGAQKLEVQRQATLNRWRQAQRERNPRPVGVLTTIIEEAAANGGDLPDDRKFLLDWEPFRRQSHGVRPLAQAIKFKDPEKRRVADDQLRAWHEKYTPRYAFETEEEALARQPRKALKGDEYD